MHIGSGIAAGANAAFAARYTAVLPGLPQRTCLVVGCAANLRFHHGRGCLVHELRGQAAKEAHDLTGTSHVKRASRVRRGKDNRLCHRFWRVHGGRQLGFEAGVVFGMLREGRANAGRLDQRDETGTFSSINSRRSASVKPLMACLVVAYMLWMGKAKSDATLPRLINAPPRLRSVFSAVVEP